MSTPPNTPSTPRGTCSLTLTINGTRYGVKPVAFDRRAARRCFELKKRDGTFYHVALLDYGAECTCPDFVFNREGLDPLGCKHVRALVALGVIDTRPVAANRIPPSAYSDEDLEYP